VTEKGSRDRLRVAAMKEAAIEAMRDAAAGKDSFLEAGLRQKAILLDLIHLTESAERTSFGLKRLNSGIPWGRLSELRNRGLVRDFEDVYLEDVWAFVRMELPKILRQLDRLTYSD
jgi:uncharacterized protein with HEPN domain